MPTKANQLTVQTQRNPLVLTPLTDERRTHLPTDETAALLNRQPQTLRHWAMAGTGPLKAARINGRLAWPVAELRRILGVA